jgi:predicted RNA-binding protein associated with RNAse of E/G family
VIIYPDGRELILDADEAADALEQGLITKEQMIKALRSFNSLLEVIRHGEFDNLIAKLNL